MATVDVKGLMRMRRVAMFDCHSPRPALSVSDTRRFAIGRKLLRLFKPNTYGNASVDEGCSV